MSHHLLSDSRLESFLLEVDRDLAQKARDERCPHCGEALHSGHYPRKPRGGPDGLPAELRLRFSFSCSADDCRRRVTPPSVRFLGRKVYVMAVVVLVTAMRQGPTPRGLRLLQRHLGVDRRTIARWQRFFGEIFRASSFWKAARRRLSSAVDEERLPRSLLDRFRSHARAFGDALLELLRFLSPITVRGALSAEGA
ncbi:MAG: hypothetical protein HY721_04525 [Planctomycetes bacterium]|nr:hypothetical protein [Planctomycetota bacterium]